MLQKRIGELFILYFKNEFFLPVKKKLHSFVNLTG